MAVNSRGSLGEERTQTGDEAGAEPALRAVLALDPAHAEARHNRDVLRRRRADTGASPAANRPV